MPLLWKLNGTISSRNHESFTSSGPGRFVLTGSANLLLMKEVSESLAGRAAYITLERDLRELSAVDDLVASRRAMQAFALRTGTPVNSAAVASELGLVARTLRRWLDLLNVSYQSCNCRLTQRGNPPGSESARSITGTTLGWHFILVTHGNRRAYIWKR